MGKHPLDGDLELWKSIRHRFPNDTVVDPVVGVTNEVSLSTQVAPNDLWAVGFGSVSEAYSCFGQHLEQPLDDKLHRSVVLAGLKIHTRGVGFDLKDIIEDVFKVTALEVRKQALPPLQCAPTSTRGGSC